jgi:RHS repeat-associated protein
VYIYLSNENDTPVEVYFDDIKVEHVKSPVVQMDDYYPFGGRFDSFTRENSLHNKRLYNAGSELQTDLGLDTYITDLRMYDPWGRLGWWQIDPKVDEFYDQSPYNFSFNNPIRYNDPKGDCPTCPASQGELDATSDGQMGAGLVESFTDAAKGAWHAVTNPVETVTGVWNAVTNPVETVTAIKDATVQSFNENSGKFTGKVVGNVLMAAATAGVAAEVKAATSTENVVRVMSKAELSATKSTGLVRGGREGTHYATTAASNDAKRATQRLALPKPPQVKVTLQVPKGTFSQPTKVKPANGMPGGGVERKATGKIPAKVIDEKPMKNTTN